MVIVCDFRRLEICEIIKWTNELVREQPFSKVETDRRVPEASKRLMSGTHRLLEMLREIINIY